MVVEEMRRESYIFSGVLHVAVALVAFFGLPHFFRDPPEVETPIVVDLVPIGEKTNPPPKQAEEPQPEPPKPEEAPKPEPVKVEPPKPTPAPPPPPPPPPKPAEPEPVPVPAPKPEPKKPEPKPEPKPQQQQKLSDIKPPKRPEPPADPLDSLLKSVEKAKPKSNPLDDLMKAADKAKPAADKGTQSRPQNVRGSDAHNPNAPISMTEMDAIRAHVSKYWNIPAGAKDADKLVIEIRVAVQPDGSVTDAQIVNAPMMADSFYQAAADSARRAVRLASPLPIPRDKYDQFRDFVLVFNPKQMIMGR